MANLREELNGEPLWGLPQDISDELIDAHDHTIRRFAFSTLTFIIMIVGFIVGAFLWAYLEALNNKAAIAKATELNAVLFETNFGIGLLMVLFIWIIALMPIRLLIVKMLPMPHKGALFWNHSKDIGQIGKRSEKTIRKIMERNDHPQTASDLINQLADLHVKKMLGFIMPLIALTTIITYKDIQTFSTYSETGYYHAGFFSEKSQPWRNASFVELGCNHVTGRNARDDLVYKVLFNDGDSLSIDGADPVKGTWLEQAEKIDAELVDNGARFSRWKWRKRNPLHPICLNVQRNKYSKNELAKLIQLIRIGDFESDVESASGLHAIAKMFKTTGSYARAEEYLYKALAKNEVDFGSNHPETAYTLDRLGSVAYWVKDYDKARDFHIRALKIRKATLGETNSKTATSMHNLGLAYKHLREYEKAEELYLEALKIKEDIYKDNPRRTVVTLNVLASLYTAQTKYSDAEAIYLRALKIRENQPDKNDVDIADSLNRLGSFYYTTGEYKKSESHHKRELEIRETKLGKNHEKTATSLNDLGLAYKYQGEYDKAESLYLRSLEIKEAILETDHPSIVPTLSNLGALYKDKGAYAKAEPLLLRARSIIESLDYDHSSTGPNLNNLGSLYEKQGLYDKAEPLLLKGLEIKETKLEEMHLSIAFSLENLGSLYSKTQDYAKAKTHYQRALKSRHFILGEDHPKTIEVLKKLNSTSN